MKNLILLIFMMFFTHSVFAQQPVITVTSAIWGGRDVTAKISELCNGKEKCSQKITSALVSKSGVPKDTSFKVSWTCSDDSTVFIQTIPHQTLEKLLQMTCKMKKIIPKVSTFEITSDISLSDNNCPGTKQTLYRCVRNGYFDAVRVIRNMLGDERAEHASWKITSLLNGRSQENLDDYHWAKEEATRILLQKKKEFGTCSISSESSYITAGGGSLGKSDAALGILTSNGSGYAEDYCTWSKDQKSVVLVLEDRYGINGLAKDVSYDKKRGEEYAFPIFIPNDAITAAYTHYLAIYKVIENKQVKIEVRERIKKGFAKLQQVASFLENSRETQPLKLVITTCSEEEDCVSSEENITKAEQVIPGLKKSLTQVTDLYQQRFKIIVP